MYGKALTNREAQKHLTKNGFMLMRQSGDHLIYKRESDGQSVVITTGKPLSQKTWKRECKKVGISNGTEN